MSSATSAMGCSIAAGDGASSESFTDIAEVTDISGPSESVEVIDVTHLGSASSRREYISGAIDSGEVTISGNYLPATAAQTVLRTNMNARTENNYQITFTDTGSTTWTFAARVTAHEVTMSEGDAVSFSATLKISGAITVA